MSDTFFRGEMRSGDELVAMIGSRDRRIAELKAELEVYKDLERRYLAARYDYMNENERLLKVKEAAENAVESLWLPSPSDYHYDETAHQAVLALTAALKEKDDGK